MSGRILAYSYSEGPTTGSTASFVSTNTIRVNPGAGSVYLRHAAPAHFLDVLAEWQSLATANAPAGAPWTFSYSSTTRRVTLASGAGNFAYTLDGNTAAWLGFSTAAATGAASYTGDLEPQGVIEARGVEAEAYDDGSRVQRIDSRHGRSDAPAWGNHDRCRVRVYLDASQAAHLSSYCMTGRLRVIQKESHAAIAYTPLVPHGYVDGYVVEQPELRTLGLGEDVIVADLLLAVGR